MFTADEDIARSCDAQPGTDGEIGLPLSFLLVHAMSAPNMAYSTPFTIAISVGTLPAAEMPWDKLLCSAFATANAAGAASKPMRPSKRMWTFATTFPIANALHTSTDHEIFCAVSGTIVLC